MREKERMTIQKKMIYLSISAAVIILFSIIAQTMSNNANDLTGEMNNTRYLSYVLADEFRQTSMDLTRLCRTYGATGEQKYWDAYWNIVKWKIKSIWHFQMLRKASH